MDRAKEDVEASGTVWVQRTITLSEKRRGCHLVTEEIFSQLPEIARFSIGLCHLFLQHTSASLTINENADADVRRDMETVLDRLVPENQPLTHTLEGPDDMPAHVKSSLFGVGQTIPVVQGRLGLGTWQGLYLCEHRNRGGRRSVVATIFGWTISP